MPPCRLALRSLLPDNRSLARPSIACFRPFKWRPGSRSYGLAVAKSQDDGKGRDSTRSLETVLDDARSDLNAGAQGDMARKSERIATHDVAGKHVENATREEQPAAEQHCVQASAPAPGQLKPGWRIKRPTSLSPRRPKLHYRPLLHRSVLVTGRRVLTRHETHGKSGRLPSQRQLKLNKEHILVPRRESYWLQEIRKLVRRYDSKFPQTYLQDPGPPRMPTGSWPIILAARDRLRSLWARNKHNLDMDQVQLDRENADVIDVQPRRRMTRARWNLVALWLLYHEPEQAVELLAATATRPYLPSRKVSEAFDYLVLHCRHCEDRARKIRYMSRLADVLLRVVERNPEVRLRFVHGGTVRHLIPYMTSKQVNSIWAAICEKRIVLLWPTLLHFARRLIDDGHFERGFDAIKEAQRLGASPFSQAFTSSCAYLLRSASRQPSGLRVTMRLVEDLAAMGVPLNLQMCNVVILNAIEGGDPNTAFALYRSLVQNGLQADKYTYSILLKGCRAINDADVLNETIRSATAHVNIQQNERLATEILNCLAHFHTKKDPSTTFDRLLEAYDQMFDSSPLHMLGLTKQHSASPHLMPPPHQAIGIMLSVYLDQVDHHSKTFLTTLKVYNRYRKLVLAGAEPFASMISEAYLPNLFLHSFIRTEKGLLSASQVIKDMQRPTEASRPVKQSPPNIQTWSIFMHGFARHGKMALAEQVLTYMRSKGMEPDVVTWNTLVKGYAAKQDESGLLNSLDRLEEGGFAWTQPTLDGVKWYRKQAALQEKLRQREQKAMESNFVTDLKAQLMQKFELAGKGSEVKVEKTPKAEERTSVSYRPLETR